MTDRALKDYEAHKALRAREKTENDAALARARASGKPQTFIAHDGCEVTVTPGGHIFYNAADWW